MDTHIITEVSPGYRAGDTKRVLGHASSHDHAIELVRDYYREISQRIVDNEQAPESIKEIAERNLAKNATMCITTKHNIVYVDGVGREMDYITIEQRPEYDLSFTK